MLQYYKCDDIHYLISKLITVCDEIIIRPTYPRAYSKLRYKHLYKRNHDNILILLNKFHFHLNVNSVHGDWHSDLCGAFFSFSLCVGL